MTNARNAAIWCRVSTHDQQELSLDTQEALVRKALDVQGYLVPPQYIIKVDWSSMDLLACPQFHQLRQWIARGEIQALGTLDRDRLQAQGLQRLLFLSECRERGVQVITAQGPPMLEGAEGQLVELALALGKEKSVLRAQQGARDGLRARALLKGLPPAPVTPYGYSWDKTKTRLQPAAEWENAKFIFDLALQGKPIRQICKELLKRTIPSSRGAATWSPSSVYHKLTNPIYGGRYYALRKEAVTPRFRTANTYGKSSVRDKDPSESVYLPNVVIESPVVSWEEWLAIQARLADNKLKAQRNAKHDYLLRSFIFCDTHWRNFRGRFRSRGFYYQCRSSTSLNRTRCPGGEINGSQLEAQAKAACRRIIENPEILEREMTKRTGAVKQTEESIRKSLLALDKKATINTNTETNLLLEKARCVASEESFARAMAIIRAQRQWIQEERGRLQRELEALKDGKAAARGLLIMRDRVAEKLNSGDNEVWRTIFNGLGMKIHVTENGGIEIALALPVKEAAIVSNTPED